MAAIAGNSRNSSYNRPKLLRSYVTAPTLVTSYASHNGRCTPNFAANAFDAATRDRATTILSRVARSYVCSEKAEERRKQSAERNPSSSPGGREVAEKVGNGKSKSAKISVIHRDGSKHGEQSLSAIPIS